VAACERAKRLANLDVLNGVDPWTAWYEGYLGTVGFRSLVLGLTVGAWWGVGGIPAGNALWYAMTNGNGSLRLLWEAGQLAQIGVRDAGEQPLHGTIPMVLGVLVRQAPGGDASLNVGVVFDAAYNPMHALMVLIALEQAVPGFGQGVKPLLASLPNILLEDGEYGMIYSHDDFFVPHPAAH